MLAGACRHSLGCGRKEPAQAGRFTGPAFARRAGPGVRTSRAFRPREGRKPRLARSAEAGRHAARHAALKRTADGSDRNKPEVMATSAAQAGSAAGERRRGLPLLPNEPALRDAGSRWSPASASGMNPDSRGLPVDRDRGRKTGVPGLRAFRSDRTGKRRDPQTFAGAVVVRSNASRTCSSRAPSRLQTDVETPGERGQGLQGGIAAALAKQEERAAR